MGKKKSKKKVSHTKIDWFGEKNQPDLKETVDALNTRLKKKKEQEKDPFHKLCLTLKEFLVDFDPIDIIISINIIELWLPNISSNVKFTVLLNVFLSIPEYEFQKNKTIDSYEKFTQFTNYLINTLPSFPMMEDYIPEIDFGAIKYELEENTYQVFYGGTIERITDFMTAFLMLHGNNSEAVNDLIHSLQIQDYIIKNMEYVIDIPEKIKHSGYFEVPKKAFWQKSRVLLENIQKIPKLTKSKLSMTLGSETIYETRDRFHDAFMQSQVNQSVFVNINGKHYPYSIRNNVSIVIDLWGEKGVENEIVSRNLCSFLSKRIPLINSKPVLLVSADEVYEHSISGVFVDSEKIYFIVLCDHENNTFDGFEKAIETALKNEWFLKEVDSHQCISLTSDQKSTVTRDDIEIIYAIDNVTTAMSSFSKPKKGLIFPLSECISFFDSIKNIEEIRKFIQFVQKHEHKIRHPYISMMDKYASFEKNYGMLEEGAIKFGLIALDPHSGSNFRFDYLKNYWYELKVRLPDKGNKWIPHNSYDGIQSLSATNKNIFSWSTEISETSLHFLMNIDEMIDFPNINLKLMHFFAEITADALSQRRSILKELPIFQLNQSIRFWCHLDIDNKLNSDFDSAETDDLLSENLFWNIESHSKDSTNIHLKVNILALMKEAETSINSQFQGKITTAIVGMLYQVNNEYPSNELFERLKATYSYPKRVALGKKSRKFDSKDSFYKLPDPIHYKTARKQLAVVIKKRGYEINTYELDEAKALINYACEDYLQIIQNFISKFNKEKLIKQLLENYDAYIQTYNTDKNRILESLNHTVKFNREEEAYQLEKEYIKQGNNHRYLIERLVANEFTGSSNPQEDDFLLLIAYADWLWTLYSASDILHNGLDVGGINIDNQYVPTVFYSEGNQEFDLSFGKERAGYNLGLTTNPNDEVEDLITEELFENLDRAFMVDLGFSFLRFMQVQDILRGWAGVNQIAMANSYSDTKSRIVDICFSQLLNTQENEKENIKKQIFKILDFLTLDSSRVLKKLGESEKSFDIPVSEHRKRDQRLNIKPLIEIDEKLLWSAGCVNRCYGIWLTRIQEGWLPADFQWKSVNKVVGNIKKEIEKNLEMVTYEVFNRYFDANYCHRGIDFYRRFKGENFVDVGDFDSLVYLPEINTWIMVECKYNQMPFCVKDMRRLQEKIFGNHKKSHLPKIMKRYEFLKDNYKRIAKVLNYSVDKSTEPKIINLYITKEINWVHRKPPIETDIQFIQVDNLEHWIQENLQLLQR